MPGSLCFIDTAVGSPPKSSFIISICSGPHPISSQNTTLLPTIGCHRNSLEFPSVDIIAWNDMISDNMFFNNSVFPTLLGPFTKMQFLLLSFCLSRLLRLWRILSWRCSWSRKNRCTVLQFLLATGSCRIRHLPSVFSWNSLSFVSVRFVVYALLTRLSFSWSRFVCLVLSAVVSTFSVCWVVSFRCSLRCLYSRSRICLLSPWCSRSHDSLSCFVLLSFFHVFFGRFFVAFRLFFFDNHHFVVFVFEVWYFYISFTSYPWSFLRGVFPRCCRGILAAVCSGICWVWSGRVRTDIWCTLWVFCLLSEVSKTVILSEKGKSSFVIGMIVCKCGLLNLLQVFSPLRRQGIWGNTSFPAGKSDFVHFSLGIRHLMALNLLIFVIINWPQCVNSTIKFGDVSTIWGPCESEACAPPQTPVWNRHWVLAAVV